MPSCLPGWIASQAARLIPPFKDVYERIKAHIEGNNQRTDHDMADLVEGGERLSPDEAMRRWCATRRVLADPESLDLLLQQWRKPTTVGRNGIALTIMGQTFRYGQFEPALRPFKALHKSARKSIRVSYDPHDVRTIRVYDQQFRFISVANMNDQGGLHDGGAISQEKVADLNRQKNHYLKAKKHVADYGITGVLTNEEQLAAIAAKPPKPAEPSSLRLIQTPVDGQSREIARQQFRKAVGAESSTPGEHMGISILEQLRQQHQIARRADADEFSSDPWASVRSNGHG